MARGLCRVAPTLALLATVMSLSAPDTSLAAQAPKGFFGVHPRFIDGDIDYAEMKAADVGLLRTGFNIAGVKAHANDAYDWGHFDSIVTGTASNGIDLLPVLLGVPRYISTKPGAVPARQLGDGMARLPDGPRRALRPGRRVLVAQPRDPLPADRGMADLERGERAQQLEGKAEAP